MGKIYKIWKKKNWYFIIKNIYNCILRRLFYRESLFSLERKIKKFCKKVKKIIELHSVKRQ